MKKKECPNPIIISSNMGVGNLAKEMLQSAPYINPQFAFTVAKEKHKCISTSASTHSCVRADATSVRVDRKKY
jgi:hypothetical protein